MQFSLNETEQLIVGSLHLKSNNNAKCKLPQILNADGQ